MLYLNHIGYPLLQYKHKKSYFAAKCDVVYLGPSHGLIIICNTISSSLVPRLSVGVGKREPGIHSLHMRLISQKSWEIGNYHVISVKL